jgi:ribose transport system permease protein
MMRLGGALAARRNGERGGSAVLALLVVGLFLVTALAIPGYATFNSVRSILLLASLLGIASIGQTLTIVLGGLDLSIPAVIGFADVTLTQLYGNGWPIAGVMLLVLAAALAIGAINGLAARAMDVHPLIVTLATGSILLGAILAVTHGQASGTVPDWLGGIVSVIGHTGLIPLPGVVVGWLALAVAVTVLERRSVPGRWLYAIGANPNAARLARLPSTAVWALAYAVSAGCASIAGMLLAGFSGAADAGVGEPYLFMTVAAVVVGGTPMTGGRGGYARTVAGCLIITELTTLLIGIGLDQPGQEIFLGALIVLLVALYGRQPHVRMRV